MAGLEHSSSSTCQKGLKTGGSLIGPFLRSNIRLLRRVIEPQMIDICEWLKISHPTLAHKLSALLSGGVQENEKKKYNQKTVYSIEKARTHLGYSPRSFADGMEDTTAWLIYYEYVPRKP